LMSGGLILGVAMTKMTLSISNRQTWAGVAAVFALIVLKHVLGVSVVSLASADSGHSWLHLDLVDICAAAAVAAYLMHELWLEQRLRFATLTRELSELGRMRKVERDPLTGLANQRMLESVAADRLTKGEPFALLLLDLNDFNDINEQFGYAFGDVLLHLVGDRLRSAVSSAKTVAHLFSDEFAILATDNAASEDVHSIALHLLCALDAPFSYDGASVRVTASIGIAQAPLHGNDVASLMQAATHALRAAKEAGHGVWRVYDSAMRDTTAMLRKALPAAIANGEIIPYYQPIVDLESSHVAGLEVLARWNHPTRGLLPPRLFIDLAEAEGRLSDLTLSLLHQVVRDAAKWPDTLFFAFNMAPSQLRDVDTFLLAQPTLPPERLEVELTEHQLIKDLDTTREVVRVLRSRGTRVVLDDFGAGHGNFHHLRSIPFDRLKIDREFVLDMVIDPRAEVCVRSIAETAQRLGIDVTAEGVSTPEIAARVSALGCRFVQGSLFSMPVPAAEVAALLRRLGAVPMASERHLVPA
jgi:diguanylate cyclase (GGDEF)-like protein